MADARATAAKQLLKTGRRDQELAGALAGRFSHMRAPRSVTKLLTQFERLTLQNLRLQSPCLRSWRFGRSAAWRSLTRINTTLSYPARAIRSDMCSIHLYGPSDRTRPEDASWHAASPQVPSLSLVHHVQPSPVIEPGIGATSQVFMTVFSGI